MQFFTFTTVFFAVASGVMAAPAPGSHLQARTCGTLTGTPLELCQDACEAACSVIPSSLAKDACKKSCTLGPLKARDDEAEAGAGGLQAREPLTGGEVCRAACAVTCNSTILALDQKFCLKECNGKCPSD